MQFRHSCKILKEIDENLGFTGIYDVGLIKAFRKRMQFIRAAHDENDLRNWKALRFERLKGARKHQHSIRLNDQFRLILEFEEDGQGKVVIIVAIEDYH